MSYISLLSILLAFYSYITFSKSTVPGYMVNQNEEENEAIIYEIYNSILLSFYSSFCYHAVGTLDPPVLPQLLKM